MIGFKETDACTLQTDEEKYALLDRVMLSYNHDAHNLIQILHMAQAIFGFISQETQMHIARKMNMSRSAVSSVMSFYAYFSAQPKGRHTIQICLGTACYVRGGKKVLESLRENLGIDVGQTTEDLRFTLEVKRCIGACGLAPAVCIDQTIHKRVNPGKIQEILRAYE